jgi:phage terminase large subunit-like protein
MEGYGFHMDDVYQGYNLTGVLSEAEGLIKDGRVNIGDNDLLKVHLLDSALKVNAENNRRRLCKLKSSCHIDGMAALLDAMCMRAAFHDEIGEQQKNAS